MTTKAFDAVCQPVSPTGYNASSVPARETSTHIIFDIGVIASEGSKHGVLMVPRDYTPATPFIAYESAPETIAANAFVYIGPGAQNDDILLPHFARYHARDKVTSSSTPKLVAA